jgi:hypothetical protein
MASGGDGVNLPSVDNGRHQRPPGCQPALTPLAAGGFELALQSRRELSHGGSDGERAASLALWVSRGGCSGLWESEESVFASVRGGRKRISLEAAAAAAVVVVVVVTAAATWILSISGRK